jgi:hypothetical protein
MPRIDGTTCHSVLRLVLAPVVALVMLALLALPSPARAADPAEVEELIRQGVEARRAGKDHAAVPLFRKAYDLERSARTAAQLGLVEAALGYWLAAEQHLNEALSFPRHPWLLRNKEDIDRTLRSVQSYIGEVVVTGAPAGAEVLLNGRGVGRLPLAEPLRVAEGPVVVEVRAPGYLASTTNLKIDGGRRESLRIALQRGSEPGKAAGGGGVRAPGPQGAGAGTGAEAGGGTEAQAHGQAAAANAGGARWLRPASFAAAAVGAAALAVGTYGLLDQRSLSRKFASQGCTTSNMAPDKGGQGCQGLYDDARGRERLAVAGFVTGGVLAAGAVVGLLLAAGQDERPQPPELSVSLSGAGGSRGASAAVTLAF